MRTVLSVRADWMRMQTEAAIKATVKMLNIIEDEYEKE